MFWLGIVTMSIKSSWSRSTGSISMLAVPTERLTSFLPGMLTLGDIADRLEVDEWGTLTFILLFVTNSVSCFVANLRIERINSNLKKKRIFSMSL